MDGCELPIFGVNQESRAGHGCTGARDILDELVHLTAKTAVAIDHDPLFDHRANSRHKTRASATIGDTPRMIVYPAPRGHTAGRQRCDGVTSCSVGDGSQALR